MDVPKFTGMSEKDMAILRANVAIQMDVMILRQRRKEVMKDASGVSVRGHVTIIRGDRKDAEIMRRYAFATARQQSTQGE